jgi:hypothetical protein
VGKVIFFILLLSSVTTFGNNLKFEKVFIILLENTNYQYALNQPFLAALAKRGAILSNYSAITHPSYPNYLALTTGSTQGKVADNVSVINARHIGDLLEAKGKSWKNYAENYPGGCYLSNQGRFVARHVPFLSFADVRTNSAYCDSHIVDASELETDLQNGSLPTYSFYSPNLDNDGHDTNVAFASVWMERVFTSFLANPKFTDGLLFVVTFDEGSFLSRKNRVLTILYGDSVIPGSRSATHFNHFSLLRTIEDTLNLGTLGLGDKTAAPITGIWNGIP